jgi:hypothetical protein
MGNEDRRPAGAGSATPTSFRLNGEHLEKAKRRAKADGITMTAALDLFLEAYGAGILNLPRRELTYDGPKR